MTFEELNKEISYLQKKLEVLKQERMNCCSHNNIYHQGYRRDGG